MEWLVRNLHETSRQLGTNMMKQSSEERAVCRMDDQGNQRCVILCLALNRVDRRKIYEFCTETKRRDAEEYLLENAVERQNEMAIAARGSDAHRPVTTETLKKWLNDFDHPSLYG